MDNTKAIKIIKILKEHGHVAFFAGGCVRDMLLNQEAHDIDIVTSATPDQVESIFKRTVPVGKQFGIIVVLMDKEEFEVATFRNDGNYSDGRRPDSISFSTPEEDAKRRDLTINGLFFDPISNKIFDFVNGSEDIKNKIIRFIGDAQDRINEDRLRILRAIRFASKLNFTMDEQTMNIISKNAHRINDVSAERIKNELDKIMMCAKPSIAFKMLHITGLLKYILPEVDALWGCKQNPKWHNEGDVAQHSMMVLDNTRKMTDDLNVLWAALLHDIGKPGTFKDENGKITTQGHDKLGKDMVISIMERMKSSNDQKDEIAALVGDHMHINFASEMRKSSLRKLVALSHFDKLLILNKADCLSSFPSDSNVEACKFDNVNFIEKFISDEKNVRHLPAPFVTGRHLIDIGMKPGPKFKEILGTIFDMQLEGKFASSEQAIEKAKELSL